MTQFMIGTYAGGLAGMDALDTVLSRANIPVDPDWDFVPYIGYADVGDGSRLGIGYPTANWHWNFLTQAQRDILKTYCSTGLSAHILIKTRTNEPDAYGSYEFKTYECIMYWPPAQEQHEGVMITDFTLEFKFLVEYTE